MLPMEIQLIMFPIDHDFFEKRLEHQMQFNAVHDSGLRQDTQLVEPRRQCDIEPSRSINPHSLPFVE